MSRDRILEQALKHELRAADMAATDACLDAETLSAWADDGLDAAAVVAAEAHVSTCARCQTLVGAMMKGAPDTAAPGTAGIADASGTFSLWRWWLAPLAAGAAAVTLWMVVPGQQQLAVAPPPEAASADRAPAAAPEAAPPPSLSAPTSTPAREREAPRDNVASAREDRRQLREEVKQEKALADAAVTPRENAAPPAPAAPSVAAAAASPAPQGQRAASQETALLRKSFAPLEIISPDPARRWRVVGSTIERTEDAGASWTPVRATSGEAITAGSAPSGSICWLIGANGLVLITVDGISFARVPLPEAVELTSIAAVDARNATVSTADGRRFRTDDSGRTWRPL
jgi:hypothetical protein